MFQYKNIKPLSSIQWLFLLKEAFCQAKSIYNNREGYLRANFDHFEISHKNGGKIIINLSENFLKILITDDYYNQSVVVFYSHIEECSVDFWKFFTEKHIMDGFTLRLKDTEEEYLSYYWKQIRECIESDHINDTTETEFLYYLLKSTE